MYTKVKDEKRNQIDVRPYKLGELANLYGVSRRTLHKWLLPFSRELGPREGHFYNVNQVKMIFKNLNLPSKIDWD